MPFHSAKYNTRFAWYTNPTMYDFSTSPPAAHISQLRHHLGMTQAEFAEMLRASRRAVQDWEGGRRAMLPGLWELALIKAERIKPLPTVRAQV